MNLMFSYDRIMPPSENTAVNRIGVLFREGLLTQDLVCLLYTSQLAAVLDELRRIEAGQGVNDELLDTIRMIAAIMNGMQEDFAYDR